jgi:DNA-binding PadR family transcriptional regulator
MSRDYRPDESLDPRETVPRPLRDPKERNGVETSRETVAEGRAPDEHRVASALETPREQSPSAERRQRYEFREQTYWLRSSEIRTLTELGKFRIVAARDLRRFRYAQEKGRMKPDLQNLLRQGLISEKFVPHEETPPRRMLALTKSGLKLLVSFDRVRTDQALYYGFKRPRETLHDADLYRLYQKASREIEERGGKNLRMVLDCELRKCVYHDLAKSGPDVNPSERKQQVAEQHGLQVVRGKIPLPDMRIEYETPDGRMARVDLELATGNYRGSHVAEQVRAGFSIYADVQDAARLRRVLDQRELTAEILSL